MLHAELQALQTRHKFPQIGCVHGKGLVAGVACVKPGTHQPDGDLARDVVRRSVEKGAADVQPGGSRGLHHQDLPAAGDHRRGRAGRLRGARRGRWPKSLGQRGRAEPDESHDDWRRDDRPRPDPAVPVSAQEERGDRAGSRSATARASALDDARHRPEADRRVSWHVVPSRGPEAVSPKSWSPDARRGNLSSSAVPDHLHYERGHDGAVVRTERAVRQAAGAELRAGAKRSRSEARERGLMVGIEYHKRFDDRSLMARQRYRAGCLANSGSARPTLFEKWYYRHSNFQNWFTAENTDAFTYIGCHYVDLLHFITGLLPVSVSVYGLKDKFPNGNEGYLWTDARVIWNERRLSQRAECPGIPGRGAGLEHAGADHVLLVHRETDRRLAEPRRPVSRRLLQPGGAGRQATGPRSIPSPARTTSSMWTTADRAWCRWAMGIVRSSILSNGRSNSRAGNAPKPSAGRYSRNGTGGASWRRRRTADSTS